MDGKVSYDVLVAPCDLTLKVVQHAKEPLTGGYSIHHIYLQCKEIQSKLLPLDANPREPERSVQVKDMQETIRDHPADFFKLNNGMTLLCEDVSYSDSDNSCKIRFGQNEGVCNGGHTYFAIVTYSPKIPEGALVHLELIEFPADLDPSAKLQEIVRIARARNNNNRLLLRSEADYLGYYDIFK